MIELSSYPNRGKKYPLEIIDIETVARQKPRLPRHISTLESKISNHFNLSEVQQPKTCPLASESLNSTVAWNILKYQLSDRASQQKHGENVRSSLKHRLEVARAMGNKQLVRILQEEFRQLETSC